MSISFRKYPIGTPNICLGFGFLAAFLDHGVQGMAFWAGANFTIGITLQLISQVKKTC